MDFLKGKFDEELTAKINGEGKVVLAEYYSFAPDFILKNIDSVCYDEAFSGWLDDRNEMFLAKADEILELYDNQKRFNKLKKAHIQDAVIPFIGAGMSMPCGYPGWTEFLRQVCNESWLPKEDLEILLNEWKYEEAAQALADNMPTVSFNEAIENTFCSDENLEGPIQLLPYIFNTSVITTNFDDVIKNCYKAANMSFSETLLGPDAHELPRYLGEGNKVLVKLHGKANSSRNRVLTHVEYEEHYGSPPCLQTIIEAISTKTLLFLGCSLGVDRTIQALTNLVTTKGHDSTTRHYAFLSIDKDKEEERLDRRDELAKANIFPIWYPADEDRNDCIEALLYKLIEGEQ